MMTMRRQPLNLPSGKEHNWPWRRPELDFSDPSTIPPFPGCLMGSFPLYEARVVAMNPAPPFGHHYWMRDQARVHLASIRARSL